MKKVEEIINYLALQVQNNPYFIVAVFDIAILGFIITLIGNIVSYMSRKKKELRFAYQTYEMISEKLTKTDGLDIFFFGKNVNRLAVTRIEFTNIGNEDIIKDDLYRSHELTVYTRDPIDILHIKYMNTDEILNCDPTVTNDKKIIVNFDTIRRKERILLDVYHNDRTDFYVSGMVKKGRVLDSLHTQGIGVLFTCGFILLILAGSGFAIFEDIFREGSMIVKAFRIIVYLISVSAFVLTIQHLYYYHVFNMKAICDPDKYTEPKRTIFDIVSGRLIKILYMN